MKSSEPMANDVDVDLGRLLASLRRNWWRIALVALVMTAIVYALLVTATPLYRAETRVLIEPRESVYTRPEGSVQNDRAILDAEGVASQVEVMTSLDLLSNVANELDLANHPEFESQPSRIDRILMAFGLESDPDNAASEESVLGTLSTNLDIYRVENSRVITIQYSSEDPELAARVPNAIAAAYVADLREAERESNASATAWLEPEIEDLQQRVREAEERVANFRAQSDLLIGQNNTVLATQQLAEISSELSRARAERATAESTLESAQASLDRGASLQSLPAVQNSSLIQVLREQQVRLDAQLADLSTDLMDNHPRLRALRSQIADIEAQIRAEEQNIVEGLETSADAARRREAELRANLDELKTEAARADEQQVQLRALERDATAQRELLESYLTRFREAAARGSRDYLPVDARVFSRAVVPSEPYFPKVMPLTAAAFAGSLLLMVVLVLLRELFSGRAMRPAQGSTTVTPQPQELALIEQVDHTASAAATGAAAGAAIGGAAMDREDEEDVEEDVPATAELTIDDAAKTLISSGVSRAIFISPEGDEAAASAVLVARQVADQGQRVILLDLTDTGAASQPTLESKSYSGITNLLAAQAQFADVIHADLHSSCHVIPIGTADRERAMRAVERLPIIMDSLGTAYDLLVIECGPTDADGVAPLMDSNTQLLISVLDPHEARVAETEQALEESGFDKPLLVTPDENAPSPTPDRDVA
ncbi:GumC family protein [Chelativorans sp. YIM 93263]|uniref:GumC family protein n=1 Tax=Chelativorans sp. YIM 93263 TaxID=2906648 RepID=UPI002378B629|nr:exopolysaccharide transport family protein [Chelativorans sp. YIM 93263]